MSKTLYDPINPPKILNDGPDCSPTEDLGPYEMEGCTACGMNFEEGQEIHQFQDVMRGSQVVCEVCYTTTGIFKEENQNANIRTMLILREIRKSK